MRRLMAIALGVGFFCASAFSYAATTVNIPKAKKAVVRVTKMRAAGVVTEISDTALKIERKVKDKVETMEFVLEKPAAKIKVGDKVKVSYKTKDNKNVAAKVTEDIPRKVVKKRKKAGNKAVKGGAAPAAK